MKHTCPHCDTPLSRSVVGNLCLNCGYVDRVRHYYNSDENTLPEPQRGNAGAVNVPRHNETVQTDTPASLSAADNHRATSHSSTPQIVNHHASSHYRKRLAQLEHRLAEPELESPLEPARSIAPSEPSHHEAPPLRTHITEPESHPVLEAVEELEHNIETEDLTHKPSPYLLDPSSLHSQHNAHADRHPSQTHTSDMTKPLDTNEAIKRADALLASAQVSTTKEPRTKFNYLIIGITALIMIGLSSFLVWSLLGPTVSQGPSSSTPPSQTSSQSPKASPSPSVQAEVILRDKQRKQDLSALATALAAYQKNTGSYPVGNDSTALTILTTSTPAYIAAINNDPLSNPEQNLIIKYNYTSDGKQFTLSASLENKQDSDASNGLYIVKNQ